MTLHDTLMRAERKRLESRIAKLEEHALTQHHAMLKMCGALQQMQHENNEMKAAIKYLDFHLDSIREYLMSQADTLPGEQRATTRGARAN